MGPTMKRAGYIKEGTESTHLNLSLLRPLITGSYPALLVSRPSSPSMPSNLINYSYRSVSVGRLVLESPWMLKSEDAKAPVVFVHRTYTHPLVNLKS